MARLTALALAMHPRMGPSFVVRFSWNSRVENPIERVKGIPAAEREYDPENRRWWIAAVHLELLADLFENWPEEVAALAAASPHDFPAVVTAVLRDRIRDAIGQVLDAVPVVAGDDILRAVGDAIGLWLDEWRRTGADASGSLPMAAARQASEAARRARSDHRTWAERAAFTREFLAPGAGDG